MGKQNKLVYENDHYKIVTGIMAETPKLMTPVYKIINKEHDMVEVETTILPRAIHIANENSDYLGRIALDDNDDTLDFEEPNENLEVVFEADFDVDDPA